MGYSRAKAPSPLSPHASKYTNRHPLHNRAKKKKGSIDTLSTFCNICGPHQKSRNIYSYQTLYDLDKCTGILDMCQHKITKLS